MLYSLMIKITKNRDLKKERKIYKGGERYDIMVKR
ncbi:hypothetical protein CCL42_gp02 [Sulfolobus islandicus rod-shaped virus 8]|uniref:Uncharacterized protein n=1 Tax=Sulfolobus islandicus rod-shaped virus 8 TaxID=1983551 RepID=A0A1X9SJK5_9VIRU|nr:hypothetical protein CCL42_gp02 [Sulfolobus islandicus rod-shaped virus 8]ARQ96408.1 hypothetical protein [Sulfolobus islandicus rod-shaped virus 8]